MNKSQYQSMGESIGRLVGSKQEQYGDSAGRSGGIFKILYPKGILPHQFDDALLMVRVLDKLSRIAQRGPSGQDLGGESPWQDIAGYGLLGWCKDCDRANLPSGSAIHGELDAAMKAVERADDNARV